MTQLNMEPVVAESYPTFWDEPTPTTHTAIVPPEDAYSAFVNLCEDDLPPDEQTDDA